MTKQKIFLVEHIRLARSHSPIKVMAVVHVRTEAETACQKWERGAWRSLGGRLYGFILNTSGIGYYYLVHSSMTTSNFGGLIPLCLRREHIKSNFACIYLVMSTLCEISRPTRTSFKLIRAA